jgi:hypothetical protein
MGNLEQAVKAAAKRADLGEDYEVHYLEPHLSWQQSLAMELRATGASIARWFGFNRAESPIVRQVLDPLQREIARWARFNDPRHLYSYCFCGQ